ncbi:MAG: preprotein translocase subunit SecG [Candidatus Marinimicrobia bacterium]|nr:preprotein translocase subunit SecG [Candidatus Neomarinimicrobiota bacterium]
MFYGVIVFIFVIVCLLLMGIILMQSSQTGGMGAAMGGGAMNAAFGGQGADKLLVRVTSGLAVTFMVLAITIGFMGHPDSTVVSRENPTLTRNKGVGEPTLTIPVDVVDPVESAAPADDSKSE